MKLSNRIQNMQESPIRKLAPYANAAKKAGKHVYHLNIGQPDIPTPQSYFETVGEFSQKVLAYADSAGDPELLQATSDYYKTYDIDFSPEDILITNGGSEALLFAFSIVCDPGDNVLVIEPFYTNYNGFAGQVSVEVKGLPTHAENGFRLPAKEEVLAAIDERTRAILVNNPGNPTGVVYTKEEIDMLVEVAMEEDLFIISDEVYCEFVYDDLTYISFAHYPEAADRVIIIDSISKRFSACGARIGSLACKNPEVIANGLKLCQGRLCVATLEMKGAIGLYQTPTSYFDEINKEYEHRRNVLFDTLQEMPGVVCEKPRGAFYAAVKLPVDDAEKFIIWLLEEFDVDGETLMMAPLEGFYSTKGLGKDEVRVAYVLEEDDLKKAMKILKLGLEEYPGRSNV